MSGAAWRSGAWLLAGALLSAAAGCSRLVILHDPLTAPEHNDLGVAYETQGQPRLAEKQYRRALGIDPRFVRARVNLGNLHAAAGRWPKAEATYRRALRDEPRDPDALNNLAVALMHGGDRKLAEAEARALAAIEAAGAADSIPRATLAEVRAARERAAKPRP